MRYIVPQLRMASDQVFPTSAQRNERSCRHHCSYTKPQNLVRHPTPPFPHLLSFRCHSELPLQSFNAQLLSKRVSTPYIDSPPSSPTNNPAMLLTKPLSTFLNANRSPHIHTLLLITPTGKLLSSSSSVPASLLRNQATIACSVWELYGPITSAGTISASLPPNPASSSDDEDNNAHQSSDPSVSSILIQLETGTMVIRALRCSLLFVVIGPCPLASSTSARRLTQGLSYLSVQSATSPPASSHSQTNGEVTERRPDGSSTNLYGLGGGVGAADGGEH